MATAGGAAHLADRVTGFQLGVLKEVSSPQCGPERTPWAGPLGIEPVRRQSYARVGGGLRCVRVQAWREDYPWLELAFRHFGRSGRAASEGWRARIEDELQATLDFKLRPDGTATVWCGMSGYDFRHDPTPKELLEGLADAYRREVKRVGGRYPTRTSQWKMSEAAAAESVATPDPTEPVAVVTREGPVEISPAAREALLQEIGRRGRADPVVRALESGSTANPVSLDRMGKIVVFDAVWALAEHAGGDDAIDPQLRLLRERLRRDIAQGPTAT